MYKFFQSLDNLLICRKINKEAKVSMQQIIEAVNPVFSDLPREVQNKILVEFSAVRIDVYGYKSQTIHEIFEHYYQSYTNMAIFEAKSQQSLGQEILSIIPFIPKTDSQDQVESYKARYENEYTLYVLYRDELRRCFDSINTKVEQEVKATNGMAMLKKIKKVTGKISAADQIAIREYIINNNHSELERYLQDKIDSRLAIFANLASESARKLGIKLGLSEFTLLNNKYSELLSKYLAKHFLADSKSREENLIIELEQYLESYKNELLKLNQNYIEKYLINLSRLALPDDLMKYASIGTYQNLSASISHAGTQLMNKILSKKQADDFSFTLMLTGSKTNSAILTFLHQNCIPFISIIKKILFLIYGPLLTFYEKTFDSKDKMSENNTYTVINRLIINLKLILPALAMVISFIFLAPLFNDFLLALIIPASMSVVLKVSNFLSDLISSILELRKPKDLVNSRLVNIFGHELAYKVVEYYQKKTNSLKIKISELEDRRYVTLSKDSEIKLKSLREELIVLQKEWRLLSTFNACAEGVTTEQAREIYFTRIAKSALRKNSRQHKLYTEHKAQATHEVFLINQMLSNQIDCHVHNQSQVVAPVVSNPITFLRLAEKQRARQYRIDEFAFQVQAESLSLRKVQ